MTKETKPFQTEVKQMLDLMIHSLYSQKEIFLRELISNSSDALDKLRYEEIIDTSLESSGEEKHIRLTPDQSNGTLTISDNGIGMSYDEVERNIGTIAYSGTKNFIAKAKELKEKPELIGQFGVGFYSSFMVADKVTLVTQKAGHTEATRWESTGDGNYTIETTTRPEGHGTTITLTLKKGDKEDHPQDFTEQWAIKSLVKKYSDFIAYPIKMQMTREEAAKDAKGEPIADKTETIVTDEILNSQKALWLRSSKEIKDDEYKEFYRHLTSDWSDPLQHIHYRAEGTQEFSALMYVPGAVPFDYNQREMKYGLSLYVKRVFIMDNCEQLIPQYLRFLKGVVDSSDLPLNVSREMVQQDRQILGIRKALTAKVLRSLESLMQDNRAEYEKFWKNFGATLKEGMAMDGENKDKLYGLALFHTSSSDKLTSLKEYIERMPSEQKDIFYMTGESLQQLSESPHLEKLKQKNFEVLYLVDPIDEWAMSSAHEFEGKKFVSITKEELNLDGADAKKKKEEEFKTYEEKLKPVLEIFKKALADQIKDVKLSDRLVDSPVCLVSAAHDPSAHMERMMEAMGHELPKSKRILEINPSHPIFEKMLAFNEETTSDWAEILYGQALINEGSPLKNPAKFSKQISRLMLNS